MSSELERNKRIIAFSIILFVLMIELAQCFCSYYNRQNEKTSEFEKNSLIVHQYKDSIDKLNKIIALDSVKTVEIVKFVDRKKVVFRKIVDTCILKDTVRLEVLTVFNEVVDTLMCEIEQKDTIIDRQKNVITLLGDANVDLQKMYIREKGNCVSLTKSLESERKKVKNRNIVIGGVCAVGVGAIVTAIVCANGR